MSCVRFNIPTQGAHRALRDVQMCFDLLARMHSEQLITQAAPAAGKRQAAFSFAA